MSRSNAYAAYIEVATATKVYNINITFSRSSLPPFPISDNQLPEYTLINPTPCAVKVAEDVVGLALFCVPNPRKNMLAAGKSGRNATFNLFFFWLG